MTDTRQNRPYHSPQRQRQAEQTRRNVLEAARRLFAAQGYAATTLPAIAREAGVSPATVTAVFGTKSRLLDDLVHLIVRGDTDALPLTERSWWQAMLSEPDPRRQLTVYAANGRRIHERSADIAAIMQGAAAAEPEIAAKLRLLADGRRADALTVAQSLAAKRALASGVSVEQATDILWALGSHDLYRMLAVERGWAPENYERWLAESLIHALVDSGASSQ